MPTQPCKRCHGRGYLEITLGLAGQDPREIGASNIVWGEKYPPSKCTACNQTGKETIKPTQPSRQIINTDHHINSIQCN